MAPAALPHSIPTSKELPTGKRIEKSDVTQPRAEPKKVKMIQELKKQDSLDDASDKVISPPWIKRGEISKTALRAVCKSKK